METVIIVIHLMVVLALVGVVLLQRSEGGGLGIGGGSGFMTARGAANALTRATAILAAAFFLTSLTLSIIARYGEQPIDILDRLPAEQGAPAGSGGVLDQLGGSTPPAAPPSGDGASAPAMAPETNSMAPATNTMAPESNTMAPETNTMAPATNTMAPQPPLAPAEPAAPQVPNQ